MKKQERELLNGVRKHIREHLASGKPPLPEWNEVANNLPTWIWIGDKLREAGISTEDQASVEEACRLALRTNDEWGDVEPDVEKLALEIQRLLQEAPPLDQLPYAD